MFAQLLLFSPLNHVLSSSDTFNEIMVCSLVWKNWKMEDRESARYPFGLSNLLAARETAENSGKTETLMLNFSIDGQGGVAARAPAGSVDINQLLWSKGYQRWFNNYSIVWIMHRWKSWK